MICMHGGLSLFRTVSNARQGRIMKKKKEVKNQQSFFPTRPNVALFYSSYHQSDFRNDIILNYTSEYAFRRTKFLNYCIAYTYEKCDPSEILWRDEFRMLGNRRDPRLFHPSWLSYFRSFQILHRITSTRKVSVTSSLFTLLPAIQCEKNTPEKGGTCDTSTDATGVPIIPHLIFER